MGQKTRRNKEGRFLCSIFSRSSATFVSFVVQKEETRFDTKSERVSFSPVITDSVF